MSESSIYRPPAGASGRALTSSDFAVDPVRKSWFLPLVMRLHFYIGLFVGPFLLVAALSGIVYALTPQLEDVVYRKALYTDTSGPSMTLERQIETAYALMGPEARLEAVRPAPMPGTTTRVMFTGPHLGPSESHAVFIDPVSSEVRASLEVYGTSGVLPLRSYLDRFHRGLLLGDVGRLYSELAASWLWLLAIGGLVLWFTRRKRQLGSHHGATAVLGKRNQRLGRWHGTLGAWVFLGVLFFSITGLTWSNHAGSNIGVLRAHYGWGTPSVSTSLPSAAVSSERKPLSGGEHALHHAPAIGQKAAVDAAMFDAVLHIAREAGIQAGKVEIRPPRAADKAWTVTEIDRSWPTQVDAVSIDPRDLSIVDQTDFNTFPIAAKLTRWGIDAHMGALFGLPNQLILVTMALSLTVMIVWGYMMWWRRRPTRARGPRQGVMALARKAPLPALLALFAVAVGLGIFLPVMGVSLIAFLSLDVLLQRRASR